MRISIACLYLIIFYSISFSANCQRTNEYHVEVGGLVASDQTPFWLRANQYGIVPLRGSFARFNAGFQSDYRPADSTGHRRKTDWGYKLDAVANAGVANQFLLPEAYIKGRVGAFELYVGRRREIVGLVDTLLTTGAYAWSGNALPIPKIQLAVPTFTAIPFTKGVLSFMGAFAHGWFENSDRLVTGSYLHQKYLYGRLGKPTWPFRLYAGFNHQVIWAGKSNFLPDYVAVNGQLPSSIRYYPAVILGSRGTQPNGVDVTSFEDNRIGNHLGSLDIATDVNVGQLNIFVYRQFLYDDGSLFYGTNVADGLNGLRIKNRQEPPGTGFFLRQITFEYLFTGSQGGDVFVIDDDKRRGRDEYFNHSQFIDGWTYYKRTIGTPFLTPKDEVNPSLPPGLAISNNRVSVYHLGISALLFNKIGITTRLSYSLNAGTYTVVYPTTPRQFSGLLTASVPLDILGGTTLNGSFAVDSGELLPNSVGTYISLRKTGFLGKRSKTPVTTPYMRFR
ncbi:capsule assembly Wzi family protein [Spirosoma soli]|uniref:Capsule assembly Wzi family protein n=1 Tax=Spirosoma soli TaxID=1770529 RepID=A0ABW5M4Y5_9BACT